ncbi:MAG: DUF4214 domain-containing protein [Actinomycetota bacterium]
MIVAVLGTGVGSAAQSPSQAAGPVPDFVAPGPFLDGPANERARGLVFDGLRPSLPDEACKGAFELRLASGETSCTHGPDPAPVDIDVREPAPVPSVSAETAALSTMACQGDGVTGKRVQLVYARPSNNSDRYSSFVANIRLWAAQMDDMVNLSAAQTGGVRHIRFVHDSSCVPTVLNVTLSSAGDDTFTNTINELRALGHNRSDRKYMVWMDSNVYCGIAQVYNDDRPGQDNPNNGISQVPGMVARVDRACWGSANSVELHELVHTLGSVQPTAPNATANGHCTDEYDRLCYTDAVGVQMRYLCPSSNEVRLDCNNDDYFSTAPVPGTWLATHWNTANSAFLTSSSGQVPSPTTTTTTTVPPTTTTTVPPTTTTVPPTTTTTVPPTTTTVPPTTTTTVPPTTTTTVPSPTTTTVPPTTTTVPPTTTTVPPTTTTVPPTTTTTTTVPPGQSQSARFVDSSYAHILGRPPAAIEKTAWLNAFTLGITRAQMVNALFASTEYRRTAVDVYYRAYLGRPASGAEIDHLVGLVGAGWLWEWVQMAIIGSDEFYARRGGTPAAFVDALCLFTIGTVDANARAFWVDQMNKGMSRYTVALAFTTSPVARQNVVKVGFSWYLGRPASANEVLVWSNQITNGMRQEAFFAALVASPEYLLKV